MTYDMIKRAMDIAASALALVALAPLLAVIAILVPIDSRGAPFFAHKRVGRGGRVFSMLKFRSMVKNAPSLGSWQTASNDPRITRIGGFLRNTSLDELPQFINVLIGDMSLVGPRPETPMQQELYRPEDWQARHRVRPGITGLAQVSGRSDISAEERLRCDLIYASAPSLKMDIDIMGKTFWLVMSRKGVN